jgi:hypothetical protein
MIEDFRIKDTTCIVRDEYCLDLHNNYDFLEVFYSIAERRVTLTWHRSEGDWVPLTDPSQVDLVFLGVTRFHFVQRDPEMPFTEDRCLWTVGYWIDEEWCDGVMICEADPESHWLRAFSFHSGAIVAIAAEEAKAIIRH